MEQLRNWVLIPVCPELEGGLSTPRPPAEITGDQVLQEGGEDVTRQFVKGAALCRDKGVAKHATLAILKSRSPACGCGQVYDGSFTGTLIKGDGIFTRTLRSAGIACVSDEDYRGAIDHPAEP